MRARDVLCILSPLWVIVAVNVIKCGLAIKRNCNYFIQRPRRRTLIQNHHCKQPQCRMYIDRMRGGAETTYVTQDARLVSTADGQARFGLLARQKQLLERAARQASYIWSQYKAFWGQMDKDFLTSRYPWHVWFLNLVDNLSKRVPPWLWTMLLHSAEQGGGPTLLGMYASVLLGASCGFYLFLYFISLGYAAGIGLPLSIALTHFIYTFGNLNGKHSDKVPLPTNFFLLSTPQRRTVLHAFLVILWSLRMFLFLLWREYWNWPALHKRMLQVNQRPPRRQQQQVKEMIQLNASSATDDCNYEKTDAPTQAQDDQPVESSVTPQLLPEQQQQQPFPPPSFPAKVICWMVYSFFYLCMLSPSYFRMHHELVEGVAAATFQSADAAAAAAATTTTTKGLLEQPLRVAAENMALSLQTVGLVLETVADWQKSVFKAQPNCRFEWCQTGVWKISTHPNYLGEGLFWFGTFMGGWVSWVHAIWTLSPNKWSQVLYQCVFMLIGLAFIFRVLQGAVESLDARQESKYGDLSEYATFRQTHGLWGPRWWIAVPSAQSKPVSLPTAVAANVAADDIEAEAAAAVAMVETDTSTYNKDGRDLKKGNSNRGGKT